MGKLFFVGKYKIDGVESYATPIDCFNYIKDKTLLGLDIETSKDKEKIGSYREEVYKGELDPYLSNIVMLQIGDLETQFAIDVRDFSYEELLPVLNFIDYNSNVTFIGVNLKFEAKFLKHNFGINLHTIHDCMIVEMCLTNGLKGKYSLAKLAQRYLGVSSTTTTTLFDDMVEVTMDDDIIELNEFINTPFEIANNEQIDKSTRLQFINIGEKPFTKEQVLYGVDDIIYPILIREKQLQGRILDDKSIYCPTLLFAVENNVALVLGDIELNGLPVDKKKWMELAEEAEKTWAYRLSELNKYVIQFYPKFTESPNLFDLEPKCLIDWASSKQVIGLFKHLEICPQEYSKQTKRKDYTVGAVALLKQLPNNLKEQYGKGQWVDFAKGEDGLYIEDNNTLIVNYLLTKKSEQLATTFGREWLRYVHPISGRTHSSFRQILNTGRMSSTAPNIQQLPQKSYRNPFCVKDTKRLIFSDYNSQELRVVADLADDEAMINFFVHGHPIYGADLHTYTANLTNRINNPDAPDIPPKGHPDFNEELNTLRNRTKVLEFGIIYGKEAKGFSEDFGTTEEEADKLINDFLDAYPGIREFMKNKFKETMQYGYIQIDSTLDRRWFSDSFAYLDALNTEIRNYYPKDYWDWRVSKADKEKIKEKVYEEYPFVKDKWREFFGIQGAIKRKSTNYRVQGTASGQTKAALVLLRREILKNGYTDCLLVNAIHDEIGLECKAENAEIYKEMIEQCMAEGGNLFVKNKFMKATAEIGTYWVH